MTTIELDYSQEDIGELIVMVRVQHRKLSTEAFAKELGIKEGTLEMTENGKGAHGTNIFNKLLEKGWIKNAKLVVEIPD